jgi:hypothetical protein
MLNMMAWGVRKERVRPVSMVQVAPDSKLAKMGAWFVLVLHGFLQVLEDEPGATIRPWVVRHDARCGFGHEGAAWCGAEVVDAVKPHPLGDVVVLHARRSWHGVDWKAWMAHGAQQGLALGEADRAHTPGSDVS